tara:strand:- start:1811 stop:1999 length:189 start_codon:yes stop_codon:yes gene_type:complete
MAIITKTTGYFIINEGAMALSGNTVVSYRDDATVQEFDTEALMLAAHEEQFPEQYLHDSDEL